MLRKAVQYLREVQGEIAKVTWPTREELSTSTAVVLAVTLALALFIFVADFVLSNIMDLLLI
jgi:preprotein translocase subunit SecE